MKKSDQKKRPRRATIPDACFSRSVFRLFFIFIFSLKKNAGSLAIWNYPRKRNKFTILFKLKGLRSQWQFSFWLCESNGIPFSDHDQNQKENSFNDLIPFILKGIINIFFWETSASRHHEGPINPFMPTVSFIICCPRDCVSRHNGGTAVAPLKPSETIVISEHYRLWGA